MSSNGSGPSAVRSRVALYARYSSDRQSEHSVADQLRVCRTHAERQGWDIVHSFHDAAISGTSLDRPGYQALQEAMRRGEIDIVIAEALDRISRDPEHTARFHKLMKFTGVQLITLGEGVITDLHIGLKGTMNALYITDLAAKTRRGIEGRVRAGRSVAPAPYGYRRVTGVLRPDGEVERGLREILPEEAAIVGRIFAEYAAGASPMAITRRLNQEGIRGPSGKGWNHFTISGKARSGDGMLRQRIYIGELVWNRQHRVMDPLTGQASKRVNAAAERVVTAVPELRIIEDELWARVQERLAALAAPVPAKAPHGRFWERRRPKHLLSGKIFCGVCSSTFSSTGSSRYACANGMRRFCTQTKSINRLTLEAQVLEVLAERMMDPELAALFAEEFTREWNALAAESGIAHTRLQRELDATARQLDHLVEAISNGLRSPTLQAKLSDLEAERARLEHALTETKPTTVRLMPNIGATYRTTLARLRETLASGHNAEALDAARAVIARVVIQPGLGGKPPGISIEGQFAAMLTLGQPNLPAHIANNIAKASQMSVKGSPRERVPPLCLTPQKSPPPPD
ncbi:MAG: recombinase family protein [Roseococcus sp.]